MQQYTFKRGTTLTFDCPVTLQAGDPPLSELGIKSEVRKSGNLTAELVVVKNPDGSGFQLSAPLGTSSWAYGTHLCDIKFDFNGVVVFSQTFEFIVDKEVTQ